MIVFNIPPYTGKEFDYMRESVENYKICEDGPFTKKCNAWMEKRFNAMYYNMAKSDLQKVIDRTFGFFKDNTMNVQAL